MKNNRTEYVMFRANLLETKAIEIMRNQEQIKTSELMRNLIREGLKKRGISLDFVIEQMSD